MTSRGILPIYMYRVRHKYRSNKNSVANMVSTIRCLRIIGDSYFLAQELRKKVGMHDVPYQWHNS